MLRRGGKRSAAGGFALAARSLSKTRAVYPHARWYPVIYRYLYAPRYYAWPPYPAHAHALFLLALRHGGLVAGPMALLLQTLCPKRVLPGPAGCPGTL